MFPYSSISFYALNIGIMRCEIKFRVNNKIGRRQMKTIEDDEFIDISDEDSPFTYHNDIDPAEMAGFSIRRT